jgi:gamma-glutamylcyclotransferase (GGCT)/AIG2-like uncharacterized protein YtfP
MFTYQDIDQALEVLDELEGISSEPPEYERVSWVTNTGASVWVYLGLDYERYSAGQDPKVPDGNWFQDPPDL